MPIQSVPIRDSSLPARALQQYLLLLTKYPILTKSVTSGILSALGNLLSQALESSKGSNEKKKKINVLGPVHFAIYGLVITGPVSHYFYHLLEVLFPATVPYCLVKRLLLERLIFAPAFLLVFYTVMNALEVALDEDVCQMKNNLQVFVVRFTRSFIAPNARRILMGKTVEDLQKKLANTYWSSLKMNWKVWTPFQFININYIPVQFRVLFANMVALFWYAYLASVRK